MTIEEMAVELLGLTAKERALLAEKLLASLEDEGDGEVEALWLEAAERRAEQVERGEVSGRPAGDVLHDAKTRLDK